MARLSCDLRSNISFEYYEAGHMMYVHEPPRLRQSGTLAAFVRAPLGSNVDDYPLVED